MERIIKLADLEAAVNEAYDKFKNEPFDDNDENKAADGADASQFGISVVLPDGTVIERGDTTAEFAMGDLAQIPTMTLLLENNTPETLMKRSGGCCCKKESHEDRKILKHLPLSARLMRGVSAILPSGDRDGKMDIIVSNLTAMAGGEAVLDDGIYKQLTDEAARAEVENKLAQAEFYLYDDAPIAIDIAAKLNALKVDTRRLATIGATIASDGYNPVTGQTVFDAAISQRVVAAMAAFGPGRHSEGWLISSGVPAMASFSGGMLGVVPGTLSVAAYSPAVNRRGFSKRAAHAIRYIANKLRINAFASDKIKIEK